MHYNDSDAFKERHSMKKWWAAGSIFLLLISQSGCALFLLGAGATGGLAISKDTIEGTFDKSFDDLWRASRGTVMDEGFIRLEDKTRGIIEGEVKKSQVKIEIKQVTQQAVRLRVEARKGYQVLPDIELANELYNKINQKLNRKYLHLF